MKFFKYINIRSNIVLLILALLSLGGLFIVEKNKVMRKKPWYDEKLEAAKLNQYSAQKLKHFYFGDVEFIDNINDPNETGLIGHEYSPITSERGSFAAKSTSTNPNFAALVVQFLKETGAEEGDFIAVGMTGSFPALNLSVYSALQTLKLKPVIICSVASSSWGANDPDFTWLDMDKVLSDSSGFDFRVLYATIGASQDIGRGLSTEGVEMIKAAIKRNNIEIITFNDISDDISKRLLIYSKYAEGRPIKAYINVGGGIASLGSDKNGDLIPAGLNKDLRLNKFIDKKGVAYEMAKNGIPIIQMLDITTLATNFNLPMKPIPLPFPGDGTLFQEEKYNMWVVGIITFILLSLIIFIIYQDKKNVRLGKEILRSEQESNDNELLL
jgi:poly-gamma-glutamate system protein